VWVWVWVWVWVCVCVQFDNLETVAMAGHHRENKARGQVALLLPRFYLSKVLALSN
jgi:hypothetical protein